MSKVFALNEGSYSVDASKVFIPFDASIHQPKDRPASVFVHVQPFLIENGSELLLIDTGLGYSNSEGILNIHQKIKSLGFDSQEVTKVLMSHLHFDHAGGMMQLLDNAWKPSFPNADYFLQEEELNSALSKDSKSYKKEPLEALRRYSGLQLMNGDGFIDSSISYELTGGHCQYHQIFKVRCDDEFYFYGGDVVPEAVQVIRKFIAKYDYDGRKCMEMREAFGHEAAKSNWTCLMYHDKINGIVKFKINDEGLLQIKL